MYVQKGDTDQKESQEKFPFVAFQKGDTDEDKNMNFKSNGYNKREFL